MNGEKNAAETTVIYENKDRFLANPAIARLSTDKYLLLYHDAPSLKPPAKFNPKMRLGTMTGSSPYKPDLKSKRIVPRFSGSGSTPGAARISDSLAVITDNRWFIYNWMGEPEIQVVCYYDWSIMLRGGYSVIADTSGDMLKFGKPRRITSIHYPAVSCYDNPLVKDGKSIYCPVDYDSDAMQLNDRPWESIIMKSDDLGATWQLHGTIHAEKDHPGMTRLKRPVIRELPGGGLVCTLVSHEVDSDLYFLKSDDFGKSWSEPQPTGFSGYHHSMIALSDGRILMTYSPLKEPHGVVYRISEDGGKTWPENLYGEVYIKNESDECGWARGVQLDDGSVFLVYYVHKPGNVFAISGTKLFL